MVSPATGSIKVDEVFIIGLAVGLSVGFSVAIVLICFRWFRTEQKRLQKRVLSAIARSGGNEQAFVIGGPEMDPEGELIAKFKLHKGKRIVSLIESDGKRFIHVDGDLSTLERAQMMKYLKSEGFIS